MRGTKLQRHLTSVAHRLDGNDAVGAHDARTLHRAETDRAAPEDGHIRTRVNRRQRHGRTQAGPTHAVQHRQLGGRHVGEDRRAPLLGGAHELGVPADVGGANDVSTVGRAREGNYRVSQDLATVGAPPETLVALATLRRDGDDDAITHTDALHRWSDGLDDPHAAVPVNEPLRGQHVRAGGHDRILRAQHPRNVRVAALHRLVTNDDLPALDWKEGQLPETPAVRLARALHPTAKPAARLGAGQHPRRLRLRRRASRHGAGNGRRARLEDAPTRKRSRLIRCLRHNCLLDGLVDRRTVHAYAI